MENTFLAPEIGFLLQKTENTTESYKRKKAAIIV
jgi:hypothetical protein